MNNFAQYEKRAIAYALLMGQGLETKHSLCDFAYERCESSLIHVEGTKRKRRFITMVHGNRIRGIYFIPHAAHRPDMINENTGKRSF